MKRLCSEKQIIRSSAKEQLGEVIKRKAFERVRESEIERDAKHGSSCSIARSRDIILLYMVHQGACQPSRSLKRKRRRRGQRGRNGKATIGEAKFKDKIWIRRKE